VHPTHPRGFWALITVVTSALVGVAAYALPHVDPTVAVVAFLAAAGLEALAAQANPEMRVSLAIVAEFVAVAYGGLPVALAAALGTGVVCGAFAPRNPVIKTIFNAGMFGLSATAAVLAYSAIIGAPLLNPSPEIGLSHPATLTIGLLAASAAYLVVNSVVLSLTVHFASGVPWRDTLVEIITKIALLQFLYVGLAAVAYVLLVAVNPVALILLTVPLLVGRQALRSVEERQAAFDRMVRVFVKAIEVKDGYTRGHAERVADLSVMVAARMGLTYEERQLIRYGAILHDVGKIGVSLGILCKAGPLTDDEFVEMKAHPEIGAEMLGDIDFLKPALSIVHHHHERLDGRGYPAGLAGDEIPLLARIVTAVDAFDAMTSTRSYRRALPIDVALIELEAHAGTQFDTEVVGHLVTLIREEGWEITDEPVATAPVAAPAPIAAEATV
jgi:putative nucleotidyltransferase with HDIG domain